MRPLWALGSVMDRDLVERASDGDREAFGVLARVHADRLYAIAYRILRDFDRSEDAVQQALVIAWRELPRLRDLDRFEPWLHRILVRTCYAEARRHRDWSAQIRVLPVDGPTSADETVSFADRDEVDRGFRRLPPEQRAILVLHHYLGLTRDWKMQSDRADWLTPAADRFIDLDASFQIGVSAWAVDVPSGTSSVQWIRSYYKDSAPECGIAGSVVQDVTVGGHPAKLYMEDACGDAQAFVFVDGTMHVFAVWRDQQVDLLKVFLSTVEFL
jgi:RNA polymerase sigma-70 factor, ECF subfamily